MAEEFAFDERLRNRSGIDSDERLALPAAEPVNRSGDDFFPGPAFARDHHRNIALSDAFDQFEDFTDCLARPDKVSRPVFLLHAGVEPLGLAPHFELTFRIV